MYQTKLKSQIAKLTTKKRSGVAEVISTLLLVVITVVGAVILTTFIDESFVAGSLAVSSGTDVTIKTIKLTAYDTRNGVGLMDSAYNLDNVISTGPPDTLTKVLCRDGCVTNPNTSPYNGGSDFMVIQIENRSLNSIFLKDVILDGAIHTFDVNTVSKTLDQTQPNSSGGDYPADGQFSILSIVDPTQEDREIGGGETANLLIKLDTANGDIQLSKTMRVQLNIGGSSLASFLIETGDAR